MRKQIIFIGLLLSTALVNHAIAAEKPVAVVNGKTISHNTYERYLKLRKTPQTAPHAGINREAVINELIDRELLVQEALKQKLDKDAEVTFQIQQLRVNALIQAAIQNYVKNNPITDDAIKKAYDEKIAKANIKEYKARHILLKTEQDAKAVIAELDGGAVFSDVAKAKSTGPTAKNGGDLGWFKTNQMAPSFSQAVAAMKKSSYSNTPVQTQFGWHVIKLEDSRKLTPPKFDEVKDQLKSAMQNQQLQEYVVSLRNKAKIDIK